MAQPSGRDLYVSAPLTNISVAWMQSQTNFIADKVFPNVPVDKQSDIYRRFKRGNWYRTVARERAPATESVGTGWEIDTDATYYARVYAVHNDVADQDRANADSGANVLNLDRAATELVSSDLMLRRELIWANTFFTTAVWATDLTGVTGAPIAGQFKQWDQATADAIGDIRSRSLMMAQATGRRPNVLVLGPEVESKLLDNAQVIERIKYTQQGVVTRSLLASFFNVDRVLVPEVVQNTAPEGDDADVMAWVHGKSALLAYSTPSPSTLTPTAGYTFSWNGYLGASALGSRVSRFRLEQLKADRVEGEMAFDMKVIAPDLGVFFANAVA